MEPPLHTLSEMAANAERWRYLCFALAGIATATLIIGFLSVCYWLRRIHTLLKSDRSAPERSLAKAPPLRS